VVAGAPTCGSWCPPLERGKAEARSYEECELNRAGLDRWERGLR